jgi:hypothetical protein
VSEDSAPYFVDQVLDHCASCCAPLLPAPGGGRYACTKYHGRWQNFYVTTAGPPGDGFEALPIVGAKSGRTFYVYGVRV